MKILIACEYSGRVREAFRKRGHDAISCDLESSDIEGPHVQGDVIPLLEEQWDMIIAFPPCTYLSYVGMRHWNKPGRAEKREEALQFFLKFINAKCSKIAVENPLGYPSKAYRKPDQVIQPYFFGEPYQKRTCLWLKGLPLLKPTKLLPKPKPMYICQGPKSKGKAIHWVEGIRGVKNRSKERAKIFQGIANAMAEQWG